MNKKRAERILQMLDRINDEMDILGRAIMKEKLVPVPVKVQSDRDFRRR